MSPFPMSPPLSGHSPSTPTYPAGNMWSDHHMSAAAAVAHNNHAAGLSHHGLLTTASHHAVHAGMDQGYNMYSPGTTFSST